MSSYSSVPLLLDILSSIKSTARPGATITTDSVHSFLRPPTHQSRAKSIRGHIQFNPQIFQCSLSFRTGPVVFKRCPLCVFLPELFADASAPFGIQPRADSKNRQRMDLPLLEIISGHCATPPWGWYLPGDFRGISGPRDDMQRLRSSTRRRRRNELSPALGGFEERHRVYVQIIAGTSESLLVVDET